MQIVPKRRSLPMGSKSPAKLAKEWLTRQTKRALEDGYKSIERRFEEDAVFRANCIKAGRFPDQVRAGRFAKTPPGKGPEIFEEGDRPEVRATKILLLAHALGHLGRPADERPSRWSSGTSFSRRRTPCPR